MAGNLFLSTKRGQVRVGITWPRFTLQPTRAFSNYRSDRHQLHEVRAWPEANTMSTPSKKESAF